ncbi:MmgE/PrpD family protein [Thermodesulfobacteriota bacterium]
MEATARLATFIAETSLDQIPQAAIDTAKRSALDCIGVALAGSAEPVGKIITEFVRESGGNPLATVIGGGFRTSPSFAALANGTMAHALDYDDVSSFGGGHSSVSLLPAVLALGEKLKASGKEVLEAYILGFEIGAKLVFELHGHAEKGWHHTGTINTMRSAAACAKMLKLDVEKVKVTFGIAASQAGGLNQNIGTMTKPYHAGMAAKNGIVSSVLAQKGFTANKEIFEGSIGFCNLFSGEGVKVDLDKIGKDLGNPFHIFSPGVGIKKYPCVASTHPAIDATLHIIRKYDISPAEVEGVQCGVKEIRPKMLLYPEPKTPLEGKFSLPFLIAVAILDRKVSLKQFKEEQIFHPEIRKLLRKITISVHPELVEGESSKYSTIIAINLKDGRKYQKKVDKARGLPDQPLSWDELLDKYRDCAQTALSADKIEKSIDLLGNLEELKDINKLTNIIIE